jgi:hypothetical protein
MPPDPVEMLEAEYEEVVTDFLSRSDDVERLSILSQWDPIGRPCYLRGGELDLLVKELDGLIVGPEKGSGLKEALDRIAAMARRAMTGNLILVVLPD